MANDHGWIKLHRKLKDSPEWLAEPFTKGQAWVDLLLLANHKPGTITKRGIQIEVKRGQVGYSEISLAERWGWSRGKVRRFIREMILVQQIEQQTVQQNSRLSSLISLINYDVYQSGGTTDGTANDTTNGTRTRSIRNKETPENFSELKKRYSDTGLIDQAFDAIATTRKSNRVSDSIVLAQLKKWEAYPPEQVEHGIRVYLSKNYAAQGKDEKYLTGIIRGQHMTEMKKQSNPNRLPDWM
ncbi:MAG: hypothetical protein WC799_10235 [Desulfobacteraceae bacterium]